MTPSQKPLAVLAIIPARGGSKSLPGKNILPLLGKPLIGHSIQDALSSKRINRVLVSTDDPKIAAIAKELGAEAPFLRPPEISGDYAVDVEYLRHALEWLQANESYRPDLVVTLRPTEPVRRVETIDRAIDLLAAHPEADSVRSVRVAKENPYKMWLRREDGCLKPVAFLDGVDEPYNQPRQKLPVAYWQDGYIDVARPRTILELGSSTGRRILPFVIEEDAVNIDYADELPAAENALKSRGQKPATPSERFPS